MPLYGCAPATRACRSDETKPTTEPNAPHQEISPGSAAALGGLPVRRPAGQADQFEADRTARCRRRRGGAGEAVEFGQQAKIGDTNAFNLSKIGDTNAFTSRQKSVTQTLLTFQKSVTQTLLTFAGKRAALKRLRHRFNHTGSDHQGLHRALHSQSLWRVNR